MKFIIILCLTCIFHCAGFSATNPSLAQLSKEADSLFLAGKYQLAGIAFEELSFLSEDLVTKTQSLIKKSDCCLALGNYSKAQQVLSRIFYGDMKDSLLVFAKQKTALCAYLNKDFGYAESQIIQIQSLISDSSLYYPLLPLYALILNESKKWEEAKVVLIQYSAWFEKDFAKRSLLEAEIENQYAADKYPKLKNIEKAKRLSMFLPGTGQLYSGYFWEGAINVTLQLLGLGLTGVCIYNQYYFTGLFVGTGLFQKFYSGGITRTEFLANKRNYIRVQTFNKSAKSLIVNLLQTKNAPE